MEKNIEFLQAKDSLNETIALIDMNLLKFGLFKEYLENDKFNLSDREYLMFDELYGLLTQYCFDLGILSNKLKL